MNNAYAFITRWRLEGTCEEVAAVLDDPLALPRWWPSVYLRVEQLDPPRADGVGRRVRLMTKGWLPYTLHWDLAVVESRRPFGFTIEAVGDFNGRGVWSFEQDGRFVNMTYDWRIRAEKTDPQVPVTSPEAAVRGKSPMGHGTRRGELEARARSAPRGPKPLEPKA